ncbi:methyltransferase [Actinomadura kijaniata]|uniref:methyltransferase n=1 Tax=Actinomadura kijaniata TaxID=46161 RepID=UPI003F1969EF
MSASTSEATGAAAARAIVRLNTVYFHAKALQSAVELGLFELLAEGPADVEEIRARLDIKHRRVRDFLDALVGLELLERDGRKYRNAPAAAEYLVPGQPAYLGGTVAQHSRMHYHAWARLTEALRDGRAKSAVAAQGAMAYEKHYEDLERARQVMTHMDAHNGFTADELARRLDWSAYSSFVDVGGARGNVAARIVRAHPHLTGGVFELAGVRPLFDELMERLGTADRVRFHGGDFRTDELPEADVLIFGHVLPDWPEPERARLLERAYRAVRTGGRVVLYDQMVDASETDPAVLLQRINHTMMRDDSGGYTLEEARVYLERAGFRFDRVIATDTLTREFVAVGVKDPR